MKLASSTLRVVTFILTVGFVFSACQQSERQPDMSRHLAYLESFMKKNSSSHRGGPADPVSGLQDSVTIALKQSIDGEYERSISILNDLVTRYPNDENVRLYLAIQYFKTADYKQAVPLLNDLVKSKNADIRQEAEMTLALSCASDDDGYRLMKRWLNKIVEDKNHTHFDEASQQLAFLE